MKPEKKPLPLDPRFKGATPERLAQAMRSKKTKKAQPTGKPGKSKGG